MFSFICSDISPAFLYVGTLPLSVKTKKKYGVINSIITFTAKIYSLVKYN
ncbi:hypothetical protein VEE38_09880 [Escherichia coli]|nr:hypothetical protein RVB1_09400 [Escherichia coli]BEA09603.1 hypothetical protein VEE26_01100 [Escherichia coli]BEB24384.1 hypothetical protein VEE38_09880 [Escherichia coli]